MPILRAMNKLIIALIVPTIALSAAPLAHASTANVQPDRSSWGSAPSMVAPDGAKW